MYIGRSNSSGRLASSMPSASAFSAEVNGSKPSTRTSKPASRRATSWPM
jgi:hypothetical protein